MDGGSSVAVLTYLWRILESVEHPDLINLILQYLLALTEPLASDAITPRSPAVESRRQSLLSISQADGGDDKLTPSFFNLTDLITASVTSKNAETVTAALRLITTLLIKHHPHAYSSLFKVSTTKAFSARRLYGALGRETYDYFSLAYRIGGQHGVDDAYENCVRDALSLVESHACSAARLGFIKGGSPVEYRHRSAILEDQTRNVQPHHLIQDDPLVSALMTLLETFLTNDIETNLGLTNVLAHLAACPYTSLEGWLVTDPKHYKFRLGETQLSPGATEDDEPGLNIDDQSKDINPEKAEEARFGAFHAACRAPIWPDEASPRVLKVLKYLAQQLDRIRPTVPNLDHLLAGRKRAFSGLDEMERQVQLPFSVARAPFDSIKPSRDTSRARPARPESALSNTSGHDGVTRGRTTADVAALQQPRLSLNPSIGSYSVPATLRAQSSFSMANRKLSPSPQPRRTLSPLAAVVTPDDGAQQPLSARSRSSMRAAEAQVLDRKLWFPSKIETVTPQPNTGPEPLARVERHDTPRDDEIEARLEEGMDIAEGEEGDNGNSSGSGREASLSHVLTNIVILQEFALELMALIHVRCSLLDGEVRFQ